MISISVRKPSAPVIILDLGNTTVRCRDYNNSYQGMLGGHSQEVIVQRRVELSLEGAQQLVADLNRQIGEASRG